MEWLGIIISVPARNRQTLRKSIPTVPMSPNPSSNDVNVQERERYERHRVVNCHTVNKLFRGKTRLCSSIIYLLHSLH
jgi:hypothetical protein